MGAGTGPQVRGQGGGGGVIPPWSLGFAALWHPELMAATLLLAFAYLQVVGPLRHRFGAAEAVAADRIAAFLAGLVVLYVAQGTPLEVLANAYLFSAHILQAVLLVFAAPPLLLYGLPPWLLRPLFRTRSARRLALYLTNPVRALVVFNAALALFLFPRLNELALANGWLYLLEHVLAIVSAFLLWWRVIVRIPETPPLDGAGLVVYTFAIEVIMTLPFALITFSGVPVYPTYAHAVRVIPLSPLEDQQLGGILLRLGSMLSVGGIFARSFFRWARGERKMDATLKAQLDLVSGEAWTRRVDRP